MIKKALKNQDELKDFAEKYFSKEQLAKFKNELMPEPSFPCVIIYENGEVEEDLLFCTLSDLIGMKIKKLEVPPTGVVLLKFQDVDSISDSELNIINKGLASHGLSGIIVSQDDEVHQLSHQKFVDLANSLGYNVTPEATS